MCVDIDPLHSRLDADTLQDEHRRARQGRRSRRTSLLLVREDATATVAAGGDRTSAYRAPAAIARGLGRRLRRGPRRGPAAWAQGDAEVFSSTPPGVRHGEDGAINSRAPDPSPRCPGRPTSASTATPGGAPRGLNAKLDELHAATGLAVLDGYGEALAARRIEP